MRMRRRWGIVLLALAALVLFGAGCGSDDFENNPRPPSPIEVTAKIDDEKVVVSPTKIQGSPIGAGPINLTIANLTDDRHVLSINGPTDNTTDPIVAQGTLEYKFNAEEGDYVASVDDSSIRNFSFEVGPERPSAQNDLLLP